MTEAELISACLKNEKTVKKLFFETYYNKFAFKIKYIFDIKKFYFL